MRRKWRILRKIKRIIRELKLQSLPEIKIENPETTYHDTREIFDNGRVSGYTGDLRTLFEIQNQKYCYEYLREKIANRESVTPALICEIHRNLMTGCYDKAGGKKVRDRVFIRYTIM